MATRKFSLPALKVTRRPAHRKKSISYLKRKANGPKSLTPDSERIVERQPEDTCIGLVEDFMEVAPSCSSEPKQELTCYTIDSKASVAGWEKIRHLLRAAVTESEALPLKQVCLHCQASASMRCKQCGTKGYYCHQCFLDSHSSVNIFHAAEIWKVRDKLYLGNWVC